MKDFVEIALETHLFFARIMKEHAIFLQAGFPCKNKEWIKRAEYYQEEFGEILKLPGTGDGIYDSCRKGNAASDRYPH